MILFPIRMIMHENSGTTVTITNAPVGSIRTAPGKRRQIDRIGFGKLQCMPDKGFDIPCRPVNIRRLLTLCERFVDLPIFLRIADVMPVAVIHDNPCHGAGLFPDHIGKNRNDRLDETRLQTVQKTSFHNINSRKLASPCTGMAKETAHITNGAAGIEVDVQERTVAAQGKGHFPALPCMGFEEPGPKLECLKSFRGADPFDYMRAQPFCAFEEQGEKAAPPIERRIARRLVISKQNTLDDYAAFLKGNANCTGRTARSLRVRWPMSMPAMS